VRGWISLTALFHFLNNFFRWNSHSKKKKISSLNLALLAHEILSMMATPHAALQVMSFEIKAYIEVHSICGWCYQQAVMRASTCKAITTKEKVNTIKVQSFSRILTIRYIDGTMDPSRDVPLVGTHARSSKYFR